MFSKGRRKDNMVFISFPKKSNLFSFVMCLREGRPGKCSPALKKCDVFRTVFDRKKKKSRKERIKCVSIEATKLESKCMKGHRTFSHSTVLLSVQAPVHTLSSTLCLCLKSFRESKILFNFYCVCLCLCCIDLQ